jgi:hypothetical protein
LGSFLGVKHSHSLSLLLFLCKIILGTILRIAAPAVMPVNRAPNIPTTGLGLSLDPVARLPAPLFLIPRVGFVINGDTGQNTARAMPLLLLQRLRLLANLIIRGLGPMSYYRPPRPVPIRMFTYARPHRITPHLPTHLRTFIYARPRRIIPLPATTWIRFVIIK